jgi:hypothetical protein
MRDDVMRSPSVALVWDIYLRHRTLVRLLIAVSVFTFLLNAALPESFRKFQNDPNTFDVHDADRGVTFLLMMTALLLFLAICSQTELNPQTGTRGFPHRLFTLPLTSFHLVALPMFLGVAGFEVLGVVWQSLILRLDVDAWGLLVIAAYIISHQTILWTLPALGSLRVLVLGIVGIVFIVAFGLQTFPQETVPWWLRETFLAAWIYCFLDLCRATKVRRRIGTPLDKTHRRMDYRCVAPPRCSFFFSGGSTFLVRVAEFRIPAAAAGGSNVDCRHRSPILVHAE